MFWFVRGRPDCNCLSRGAFYSRVEIGDVPEIVSEHLVKGRIVTRLLYHDSITEEETIKSLDEVGFYKKQMRLALRNCGVIDRRILMNILHLMDIKPWVKH